jgi:hypothetical protein
MTKGKLLIAGDSFAANWLSETAGWPNLITKDYDVTNVAQAGCSEYKIYKQLCSVDLNKFDHIIVSHTSPYRIYTKENPLHVNKPIHKDSCFIYSDVKEHKLSCVTEFFEKYFDMEYAEHVHNLLLKEIESMCLKHTIHITSFEWNRLYKCKNWIDFNEVFASHRGKVNHYNDKGNHIVYDRLINKLKNDEY